MQYLKVEELLFNLHQALELLQHAKHYNLAMLWFDVHCPVYDTHKNIRL